MYYDVVCSVYEQSEDGLDYRVDSHLLCGGFETEDDAMEYINTHDCTEYDDVGKTSLYTCIEIEGHNDNGSITSVVTVD